MWFKKMWEAGKTKIIQNKKKRESERVREAPLTHLSQAFLRKLLKVSQEFLKVFKRFPLIFHQFHSSEVIPLILLLRQDTHTFVRNVLRKAPKSSTRIFRIFSRSFLVVFPDLPHVSFQLWHWTFRKWVSNLRPKFPRNYL